VNGGWSEVTPLTVNATFNGSYVTNYMSNVAVGVPQSNQVLAFTWSSNTLSPLASPNQVITPADAQPGDNFGYALDMASVVLVVSSPNKGAGTIYFYVFNGQQWTLYLEFPAPSNCSSGFGETVINLPSYTLIGCRSSPNYLYVYAYTYSTNTLDLIQLWDYSNYNSQAIHQLYAFGSTTLLATISPTALTVDHVQLGYLYCPSGLTGVTCLLDVNECNETYAEECTELCVNIPGGFTCACFDGTTDCIPAVILPTLTPQSAGPVVVVVIGVVIFGFIVLASVFIVFIKKDSPISGKFDVLQENDEDILDDIGEPENKE